MSFFHHHHDRANVDINITENINEPVAVGFPQPPPPIQPPFAPVVETIEVIKEGPFGNYEVDTITERVRPDGTVIVEEVVREGFNGGW